jgi:four helix bundle protein
MHLDGRPGVSRILAKQLLRSGTSIGANIEEGQASQSEADFVSKYSIACKEARETHYWLRLLAAADIMAPKRLTELETECNELIAILTSIIKKMRSKQQ